MTFSVISSIWNDRHLTWNDGGYLSTLFSDPSLELHLVSVRSRFHGPQSSTVRSLNFPLALTRSLFRCSVSLSTVEVFAPSKNRLLPPDKAAMQSDSEVIGCLTERTKGRKAQHSEFSSENLWNLCRFFLAGWETSVNPPALKYRDSTK